MPFFIKFLKKNPTAFAFEEVQKPIPVHAQESRIRPARPSAQHRYLVNEVMRDYGYSEVQAWDYVLSRFASPEDGPDGRERSPSPETVPGFRRRPKGRIKLGARRTQPPAPSNGGASTSAHAGPTAVQTYLAFEMVRDRGITFEEAMQIIRASGY